MKHKTKKHPELDEDGKTHRTQDVLKLVMVAALASYPTRSLVL